jgi:hypothetical protein
VVLLSAILLTGCGVELLTTTAVETKLQAEQLKAMKGQISHASDTTAKINIQRALDTFNAEKGHFPATLAELAPGYIPTVPNRPDGQPYGYDPATGKVLDGPAAPAPVGPTAADAQKLEQIRAAIDGYGRAVGYYPPSLQALVPAYLAAVPKTDSGQDFVFDPQTGYLGHPAQPPRQVAAQPQAVPRPGAGGGGAGPMGEVMTGIAMQNQLNGMGSSATNAAGGYARQSVGDVTSQHNQQQEKVMDQLGL